MKAHIVLSKTRGTWHLRYKENGVRKQKQIGTLRDWPTRAEAENVNTHLLRLYNKTDDEVPTVTALVDQYRATAMPERASTRRGYESWLKNHILPEWGEKTLTELKPDPVETWLRGLSLSTKSKRNIRGLLAILWDYGMKKDFVPVGRNPMELVTIRKQIGEKRRTPVKDLTAEQFRSLLTALGDNVCLRTMWIIHLSLGLRISEVLGLKWKDVDWLGHTITIERGVVKQIVADVKTEASARVMPIAPDLLKVLQQWKQVSQFSSPEDWIFASPVKLGKQPLSYTHVWESLDRVAKAANLEHISSHAFRNAFRTWIDSLGPPVGVQQRLMRHASVTTTMNHYGTALKADMRVAHEKVLQLTRVSTGFKAS